MWCFLGSGEALTRTSTSGSDPFFAFISAALGEPIGDVDVARQTLIERARKVKRLADSPGTDGEGAAAKAVLVRMVRENGITAAELAGVAPSMGVTIVTRGGRQPDWSSVFRNATTTTRRPGPSRRRR